MTIFDDFGNVEVNHESASGILPAFVEPPTPRPSWFTGILNEDRNSDRSSEPWRIVMRGFELGYPEGMTLSLLYESPLFKEKFLGKLDLEASNIFGKARARHPHRDKSCWEADCAETPKGDEPNYAYRFTTLRLEAEKNGEPQRYYALGRIFNRKQLSTIPKPEPLIEDWLDLRTTVMMIGDTGTNKTFTMLSWGLSVATKTPWLGHEVCIGPYPVIYVVGEGSSGLDDRITAWEMANGVSVPEDMFITVMQPESFMNPDFWYQLKEMSIEIGARFVGLDTFSSLAPEADETKDAALTIRRMGDLSTAIDGSVVLAHHTGWGVKDRARGGSQFEANPDGVVILKKVNANDDDSPVSIKRKKVKERKAGLKIFVQRVQVAESCVLEICDGPSTEADSSGPEVHTEATLHARLVGLLDNPKYQIDENREFTKAVGISMLMAIFKIKKTQAYTKWNDLVGTSIMEGTKAGRFRIGPGP